MSLTLDMCTPGTTEPYGALLSPREQSTQEYLQNASNQLTPEQLHKRALDDAALQAEFYVSITHCNIHVQYTTGIVTW